MEKEINLVELLKNCPSGMELNCAAYDNVSFDKISDDKRAIYPIFCYITDEKGNRSSISFTENGCESKRYGAKCIIFPKGKTTWEGFVPPYKFKDGYVLYVDANDRGDDRYKYVFIFEEMVGRNKEEMVGSKVMAHCYMTVDGYFKPRNVYLVDSTYPIRFATEEEKQKLFDAIKHNGLKWDSKTKTLNKLIKPKFKIGDKIVNDDYVVEIIDMDIEGEVYGYKSKMGVIGGILFIEQDEWELIPDKFDVTTLKPFDKVLVRDSIFGRWKIEFFEKFDKELKFPFICMNGRYSICIPYNGNEYLHDTILPCNDYYQI